MPSQLAITSILLLFTNQSSAPSFHFNTLIVVSNVHIVAALAGAAFSSATVSPLYNPLHPSLATVFRAAPQVPLYIGIFLWIYSSLVGPWT